MVPPPRISGKRCGSFLGKAGERLPSNGVPALARHQAPTSPTGHPWSVPLIDMSSSCPTPPSNQRPAFPWLGAASGKSILPNPGKGAVPFAAPARLHFAECRARAEGHHSDSTAFQFGISWAHGHTPPFHPLPSLALLRLVCLASPSFDSRVFRPATLTFAVFDFPPRGPRSLLSDDDHSFSRFCLHRQLSFRVHRLTTSHSHRATNTDIPPSRRDVVRKQQPRSERRQRQQLRGHKLDRLVNQTAVNCHPWSVALWFPTIYALLV
jgi:hypothetical protein